MISVVPTWGVIDRGALPPPLEARASRKRTWAGLAGLLILQLGIEAERAGRLVQDHAASG